MPVKMHDQRDEIEDFLRHNNVGVLATVDTEHKPHAAAVYFVTDKNLNFFFVTKEETTKHKNLQHNSHASLAVYDARSQTTLQVDGRAVVIKDMDQFMDLFDQILQVSLDTSDSKRPPVSKLFAGDYYMYKLEPKRLRLAEYLRPDHGDLQNLFQTVIIP